MGCANYNDTDRKTEFRSTEILGNCPLPSHRQSHDLVKAYTSFYCTSLFMTFNTPPLVPGSAPHWAWPSEGQRERRCKSNALSPRSRTPKTFEATSTASDSSCSRERPTTSKDSSSKPMCTSSGSCIWRWTECPSTKNTPRMPLSTTEFGWKRNGSAFSRYWSRSASSSMTPTKDGYAPRPRRRHRRPPRKTSAGAWPAGASPPPRWGTLWTTSRRPPPDTRRRPGDQNQ
ncbi:unnamed protein product [Ectocarpus sp. 4 AP-2014]